MIGRVNTGGGGSGGTLTVTAPANVTVTVSKDGKTKTKNSGTSGVVVFKGLASGTWTLTITDGSQTSSKPVVVTADYSTVIAFFAATINITYPAGSTCTCSDGTTTLSAPDTSGTWACIVPNAGAWTVSSTNGTESDSQIVSITTDGQSKSIELSYNLRYLYKDGDKCDSATGGWVALANSANGQVTFADDAIVFYYSTFADAWMTAGTNAKIDLTGWSTLCFDMMISEHFDSYGGTATVGVTPTRTEIVVNSQPEFSVKVNPRVDSIRRIVTVDVSNINDGYVTIYGIMKAKIYKVYAVR